LHQFLLLWFCESGISGMLPLCDCNSCKLTRSQKLCFFIIPSIYYEYIQPRFQ
jgi:hypothetical protein